jgi:AbrB family looped-hinge helix DNA binding protein
MPPAIATMTSKGQITLPARMRERLGLRPGSKLVFDEQPNGDFVVRRKTVDVRELKGILKAPPGFAPTIEDYDRAVAEEVAERDARSRF